MKRGQAAGTAVLLAIIAALLVLFILFIPPAERAELLGEQKAAVQPATKVVDKADVVKQLQKQVVEKNLLTAAPGRLDFLTQKELEHSLPVLNVYTKTEPKILTEKSTAYAKKGSFSEKVAEINFAVADVEHTDHVLLHFTVNAVSGRLIVLLNSESVYDAPITVGNVQPISLPKSALQAQNKLVLAVSSPGLAFWRTNVLDLRNVKIIADVTNVASQSARNVFLVSETEKKNLEKVVVRFQPKCIFEQVGPLVITVNKKEIYKAVPDCDLPMVPIEVSPDLLAQGENEIIFMSSKGVYELSNVMVKTTLKEVEYSTYYFELAKEQYDAVVEAKRRIRLTLNFVEVMAQKKGDYTFNGQIHNFDTKEVDFVVDLSNNVVQGNNALKIRPKKTLEIRELRVDLVK